MAFDSASRLVLVTLFNGTVDPYLCFRFQLLTYSSISVKCMTSIIISGSTVMALCITTAHILSS